MVVVLRTLMGVRDDVLWEETLGMMHQLEAPSGGVKRGTKTAMGNVRDALDHCKLRYNILKT